MPPNGTARSWCTSSPRKAAATPRPKRTTSNASTMSRRPGRPRSTTRWAAPPAGRSADPPAPTEAGSPRRARHPTARSTSRPERAATYTDAFSRALLAVAEEDPRIVALTAAMPGPTGLLAFQARFPDRFFDVGIAEQHGATSAAGMAMAGLRPVVAVYSTFWSRAFDQANLDVGLHGCPVVFVLDRAGITGDDGPSHHGNLDLALALSIPGMTVMAPSSAEEVEPMLRTALELPGPSTIRVPKTAPRHVDPAEVGSGLQARRLRAGDGSVCLLGVGKTVGACLSAADELAREGIDATVWDTRVVSPPDLAMLDDAARHRLVVTAEDGVRHGGAGAFLLDAMAAQTEAAALPLARRPRARDPTSVPRPGQGRRHPRQPRSGRSRHRRERPPGLARPGRAPPRLSVRRAGRASPSWLRSGARSRSPRSTPRSTRRHRPRSLPARRGPSGPSRRSGCSRR